MKGQVSCDDSGIPAFNSQPCTNGNHVGSLITTRDPGENYLGTVVATDSGGGNLLLANDGTEYCDENGATGFSTEGPDLNIEIQVPATKRTSCSSATLSITLRGDFNNSCEVAYIVNECDVIIAQSLLTGLPERDKCDIIFPLSVMIPAADMAEAAADGVINFQIRTPSFNPNCCQGSDVDATCGTLDCNGDGNADGNCLAFTSLEWPITNAVYGGTLNSTNEIVCPGETVEIDVLQDLLFVDPVGLGDGDDNTGTYHLDFYFGGGPNPPNPYDTNLGGTAGDVVNAYTVNGVSQNPQVDIVNMGGTGVQDHSNTNAPLASGGGDLPSNTLIEVVGSVWVDGNIEPSAAGFCTGDIIGCTFTTSYISFVLLDPITATATCQPCAAGPGSDTNIGVVTISGFDGGLPDYDNTLYALQATGGTLSSTTADVGGSVTLTLDPNQHSWSVTVIDDEGCEFFLSGNCGIDVLPEINMPNFVCVDAGNIPVSVSPVGGTLSGPGISGSNFNPFDAGVGQHTITYTITEDGCSAVEELEIFVDACSGCSDPTTSITCNINYVTQDNNLNIDGGSYNTLDDGAGGICGRPIGTTDLCLFNVFIDKCGDVDLIAKFTDNTLNPNDIDAYVWGPFGNLPDEISDLTPANNIVCQPDVATTEGVPFSIDCAEVGMFYVIGVADFTGEGGGNNVFIGQTNVTEAGAGAILGCTVPEPILTADDVSVCQGESISVVVNADNVPFTCEGTLTIYEDPNGMTEAGTSGSLTLDPGCYDYFVACVPDGDCVCEVDYIPVKIFVDDLITIPMTMNIDNACGDYSQVTSETITYNQQILFPGSDIGGQMSVSVLDNQMGAAISNVVDEYVKIDGAGCYEVEYTIGADQCGGPNTETTYIRRTISPEPNFTIQDQVCLPSNADEDGVTLIPVVNSPGAQYDALVDRTWSIVEVGSGASFADLSIGEIELIEPGTYTLRLTETIEYEACGALAAGSCSATFDVQIVAQAGESLDPSFSADQTACPSEDIALTPSVDGGIFTGLGVTDNGAGTGGTFNASAPGEYVVTYTLESSNGCTNSYSLIITVDETAPTMNCPIDLTVQCGSANMNTNITNWINSVTASDDCDNITVDSEIIQDVAICGASGYRVYEFTAEDNSGNITTCTANVIIEDTTDPELTGPADITVECGTLISTSAAGPQTINAWLEAVSATDDCSDEFIFTNNYVSNGFSNGCGETGNQTVTFIVTDECGNTDDDVTTITIVDTTPPVITCAADIILQCGDVNNMAIVNNWLTGPLATDNCGDVTVSNNFTALPTTCDEEVTVTFTVQGNCDGMAVTCTATISIVDTEKPVIMTVPSDLIVECDGTADPSGAIAAWVADGGGMEVADNCDADPAITAMPGISVDNCGSTSTTPYTFTATDECGNLISEVANLVIQDTTAPTISAPAATSVSCGSDDVTAWANTVTASDLGDCNTVTTNFSLVSESTSCITGSGWTTVYTYNFTADDACNNAATPINSTYTVVDDEAPVFDAATNLILTCGDDYSALILAWIQSITATDNCNTTSVSNDYDGSLPIECGDATGIAVEFTATDGCLTSSLTLNIVQSIEDTPPSISCPSDLTLQCNDPSNSTLIDNWLELTTGNDTCGDVIVTDDYDNALALDCTSAAGTVVTFTATDACDNTATCTASILLVDNEDPVITNFPTNKTVECTAPDLANQLTDWLESFGGTIASDNCDTDLSWTNAPQTVLSLCGNTTSTPYIFTVTDDCGNTATAIAHFITEDTTDPTLALPTDLTTVECDGAGNMAALNAWLATVVGNDTCSDDVAISTVLENTISGCGDTQTLVYRFTVTDDCGNTTVGNSTFIIEDTTPPMISCPTSDLALECGNPNNINLVAAWLSTVTAMDDCSNVSVTNNFVAIPTQLACNSGSSTVTFTATDGCGNVETCTADITVNDTQAPTFLACPSDITLNTDGECGNTAVFSSPTAIDNCDVTVAQTAGMPSGTPLPLGEHTIEFTATDDCGLTATCSWTITVVDIAAPLVLCPSEDVVRCVNTDPCQWISDSSVAPSIDIENCPGYSVVFAISGATAATTGNDDATGEVFELGTSTVEYTITDGSGNTNSCVFNVVVEDCLAPMITTCPADITVTCGDPAATTLATWQATAVSTDGCDDDVEITALLFNTISGCGSTNTEVYLFTATDDAGNTSTCLSSYTIEDVTMPSISCPIATLELECGNPQNETLVAAWLATASATDGCDTPTLTNNFTSLPLDLVCEGGGSVTVTFTAEDACDNINSCTADITINDTTAPVFNNCPSNITLNTDGECGVTPIFSTPTATDNCEVLVTQTSLFGSGDEFPLGTTPVEFTATDRCGLTATCSWTITVVDVEGPLVFCPSTDVVKCADTGTCVWTSDVDVSPRLDVENCPGYTITYAISGATPAASGDDDASGEIFSLGTSTVVYTITDGSGNVSTCSFDVIVEDCEVPELTCAADIIVTCGDPAAITVATWQATASATDNCDTEVAITSVLFNTISACGSTNTEVYLYTATDNAGNTSTCLASYTIADITNPDIVCPVATLELECGDVNNDNLIAAWLATATATDDCDVPVVTHNYVAPPLGFTCEGFGLITVVFTATDACGNRSNCTADITINDNTDPVINCPSDLVLTCNNVNNATLITNWLALATADDSCRDVAVTNDYNSMLNLDCTSASGTVVTFTAIDDCDNEVTCTASIILDDEEDPTITNFPIDLTVECTAPDLAAQLAAWLAISGGAQATDNCDTDLAWANAAQVVLPLCGNTSNTPYLFTVTDDCGNTATALASFILEDTTDPILVLPGITTIECDGAGNTAALDAWLDSVDGSDTCSDDVTFAHSLDNTISACGNGEMYVYEFKVTDDCGNSTTATSTFTIEDTTVPFITCPTDNLSLECSAANNQALINTWLASTTATDICSDVTLENDYADNFAAVCGGTGVYTVLFTATDACNNTSTCSATITIVDTMRPTISCPEDLTLSCNNGNNQALIDTWLALTTGDDDCGEVVITHDFDDMLTLDCTSAAGSIVTFTATDACDNTETCTASIILVDSEKPVIMTPPADLFLECDGAGNTDAIDTWLDANTANDVTMGMMATDNCGVVTLTVVEGISADNCGTTTVITYTFTATDLCGNTEDEVAYVHIEDTTDPALTLPTATATELCTGDVEATFTAWLESATGTDACSEPTVEYVLFQERELCDGTSTLIEREYTFTAMDACNNETSDNAIFTIIDNIDPTLTAPNDLEMACGDDFSALSTDWLQTFTLVDDCQSATVINDFDGNLPDKCGGTVLVTWTVTDDCGASANTSANIIIADDTTPPVIDYCPADITITTEVGQCDAVINYGTPTANDCNGPISIVKTNGPDVGTMLEAGETEAIEFTATDACGNPSICSFTITVLDEQLPEIDCPSNDVVKCNTLGECFWLSDDDVSPIDFTDNCPNYSIMYKITGATQSTGIDDAAGEIFNLGDSYVEYFIMDANGNEVDSCDFMVVVNDCEDPEITCTDVVGVTCNDQSLSIWYQLTAASAKDNCDPNADLAVDTILLTDYSACGNTFDRVYQYTVTDQAGNATSCTARYMTIDNTVPTIIDEANDMTVQCDGTNQSILLQGWLNSQAGASATDNCGDQLTWTNNYVGNVNVICSGTTEIPVTFTVTDDCGNRNTTAATFRIEDTTPPILNLPDNLDLNCGDPLNAVLTLVWLNGATANDLCQGFSFVTNDYPGVIEDRCGLTNQATITFTSTDPCGNSNSDTRTITTTDITPPSILMQAQDIVLECGSDQMIGDWIDTNGGAVAIDNCSDEALVWTFEVGEPSEGCGLTGTTPYTFTVTDNCGNASTTTANLVTVDTTPPELTLPEDQVEECGNVVVDITTWLDEAEASDVCGDVTITSELWDSNNGCGNTFFERHLFTASDACGNTSTGFAQYQTFDTSDPVITCPQDLVLECGNIDNAILLQNWLASATAVDTYDCSNVVVSADPPTTLPELDCDGLDGLAVIFTATDDCGNLTTCAASIYVVDTVDPIFVNCPTDITVNVDVDLCAANPIFATPVATDDCEVLVEQTEGLPSGTEFPLGTTALEFTATDICGNQAICTFTLTVVDSDEPMILCPSNDVVVETTPGLCVWNSDDNVSPSISVENCPGQTISYTVTGATMANGSDDAAGVVFELGESEVCYTINDGSGNSSSCCFDVIVEDLELPEITCPEDITLIADMEVDGICFATVDWTNPTPTDNCGIGQLDYTITAPDWTMTQVDNVIPGDPASAAFPGGTNYVEYTVTDVNGNASTCSFKVNVIAIKHEKTIASVTQNPDDSYCTDYNIKVWNQGNNVGRYSLNDLPDFDDDFIILSAEYNSSVHVLTQLPTTPPTGGWSLATNQLMPGFGTHIYTLRVCTIVDLKDPNTPGDAEYTLCGFNQDPMTGLDGGQGLFNESMLDVDGDMVPDARDTVCADIPYVTHEKDFLGYTWNRANATYDAEFKVTVDNIGGDTGLYDLWDQPFFDDDFVINSASYTTDIPDGSGGVVSGTLVGSGPWTLADDQTILQGDRQCYFLTVNVSINLSDPDTEGDEIYVWCGTSDPSGLPQPGEGLYNETYLDRSNDGTPEEIEETCGDIEIVDLALQKVLVTPPNYTYGDILDFEIIITNQGNIDLYAIEINDYIPAGYAFTTVTTNDPRWSEVSPRLLLFDDIAGPLSPTQSMTIPLQLELLQTTGGYKDWDNYAELNYYEDVNGVDKSGDDVDSTPDNNDSNDNPVMVGDADDDEITEGGPLFGEDEDDHDPAGPAIFDLALRKTYDASATTLAYGGTAAFEIEVFNQGNEDAINITVTDTIPCGFVFDNSVASNSIWTYNLATSEVTTTLTTVLQPGTSTTLPLTLGIAACYDPTAWTNIAEISAADDTDPTTSTPYDLDSNPDGNTTNDVGGTVNNPNEDDVVSDARIIDEDDHDPEDIPIFDLALKKTIDNPGPYDIGDVATFKLHIHNQGNIDASQIVLNDYPASGFTFNSGSNPGWSNAAGVLSYTEAGPLVAGDSTIVLLSLTVTIDDYPEVEDWCNWAEIGSAQDTNGTIMDDIDSTPGSNSEYEYDVIYEGPDDNNICGLGPNGPNGPEDEDDHDIECIIVVGGLGDYVWKDLNGDGIQNGIEPGVEGVIVNVYTCAGTFINQMITDPTGYYFFRDLIPGDYYLQFDISDLPDGCAFTYANVGNDDTVDSDVALNGYTPCITVLGGEFDETIDAGLIPLASLGDFVWHDLDGDGIQHPNEPGLPNVSVILYNSSGQVVSSTTTDSNGYYLFDNLYPGDYYLDFITPVGMELTSSDQGINDSLDSDIDNSFGNGTTPLINLSPGENDLTWDAGYYFCVPLGDLIWYDSNGNGLYDSNENGINGMKVEVYKEIGGSFTLVEYIYSGHKPNTPSDDGYWKLCVPPGKYFVKFLAPPGDLGATLPNVGNDEEVDNDIVNVNGPNTTGTITVYSGDEKCDIGAGFSNQSTLSGEIWFDADSDGGQDLLEPGIAGITVEVYDCDGNYIRSVITDVNGQYIVLGLQAIEYYIKVIVPAGFAPTIPNAQTDDIDSDVDHSYGLNTTSKYLLIQGDNVPNIDVGFVESIILSEDLIAVALSRSNEVNTVAWSISDDRDISHYIVEKRIDDSEFEAIGTVLSVQLDNKPKYTFDDYDSSASGTYYYRIRAVFESDNQELSKVVTIDVVVEVDLVSNNKFYPIPAINDINIEVKVVVADTPIMITISDTAGKSVLVNQVLNSQAEKGKYRFSVDVSSYARGIYNIELVANGIRDNRQILLLN